MSDEYQEVFIHYQPVELCKLLKIANLVSGGGEAKIVITQGYVLLNGEVELQKRKKIISGDVIEFNGEIIKVIYQEKMTTQERCLPKTKNKNSPKQKSKNKGENSVSPNNKSEVKKNTRKPISF